MYPMLNRRNVLGQFQPFLTPTLPILDSASGAVSPAAAPAGGIPPVAKAGIAGAGLMVGLLTGTAALFAYGVGRDSSSKMVKTTGYILAGVNALAATVYIIGGPMVAMLSGDRK